MRLKNYDLIRENLLSSEKGRTIKKLSLLRVALGFPNSYEVGTSNLGFQTVYRLLNQISQVRCERFFLFDFPPYGGTKTLESNRNIRDFDIIAFSVPFEMDYAHVLQLLKRSDVPLLSADRKSNAPLVIAGGVAPTMNPEVLAPFMDCLLIGEAEEMLIEFVELYLQLRREKINKDQLLLELSRIEGIYVPRFYHPIYQEDGTVKEIDIQRGVPSVVKKRSVNLEGTEIFSPIISPHAHFKNTFLVEVGRGCARGCRFCAAGHLYQPLRFQTSDSILSQVEKHSGESRHVGLIGSMVSDHPQIEEICSALVTKGLEIGTSSLRVDKISSRLLETLVDSGMKTLTVAPEAGTDRMWKVIKKDINREVVLKSAELAFEASVPNLKLYFIVGFPYEEETDIEGIIRLVHDVHALFVKKYKPEKGKRGILRRIKVSVNPFIPKPHTPFQWCAMEKESELKRKLDKITKGIRNLKGVRMETKSVRQAVIQGVLSLGNRKVGEALYYTVEENLNLRRAWKKAGVNLNLIAFTPKELNCKLPWDIIETGIGKPSLIKEFDKAKRAAGNQAEKKPA
jgi:radical SAM superfamily enzyme YgiQ (UPF0313 family)